MSEQHFFEIIRAVREAGAIDVARVVSAIKVAVIKGESPDAMLASLRKWQPHLFHAPAERRASARMQSLRDFRNERNTKSHAHGPRNRDQ